MALIATLRHIDSFCHSFPRALFDRMSQTSSGTRDIGKRMQGVRTIHDLFGPQGGAGYIRETMKVIARLDIAQADREKICWRNAQALFKL